MVVGGRELIDTLWNVNFTFQDAELIDAIRINRYIMECKLKVSLGYNTIGKRINRYIMECK